MTRARAFALAATLAALVPGRATAQGSAYEQLQTFSGLLSQIRLNYADTVTTQRLIRGAINGMLASLDPHSYFLAGDESSRLEAWRAGNLAATGIIVEEAADGAMTVQDVYPRSPAASAGVAPGDRIISINDTVVAGLSAPAVQSRLIGERGSRVRLYLERGSRLEPENVTVTVRNADIRPVSVPVARTLPGNIGYVRLAEFMPESARELENAINRVARGDHRKLILDLRGNPGGVVQAAVDIASLFLERGKLVFKARGRRRDIAHDYLTERGGPFRDMALIVLIDEHSASAAEALSGSLQDHDRALILGRRSFGKALMQMPFLVPPAGDAVWLTVGWILTPSGRLIQRRYRGLSLAQYYEMAGRGGAAADTVDVFRTDNGRVVRGGGGIQPDSILPPWPTYPAWWSAAADSGFLTTVADSIANTLPATPADRDHWLLTPADWRRLLPPLYALVRARLGVRATPDSTVEARMARALAARVAEVRWGADADDDLRLRHDADVNAAVAFFPSMDALLRRR